MTRNIKKNIIFILNLLIKKNRNLVIRDFVPLLNKNL